MIYIIIICILISVNYAKYINKILTLKLTPIDRITRNSALAYNYIHINTHIISELQTLVNAQLKHYAQDLIL